MKRLFITCFLFLSLSSCKEFLDIKPHEETIPQSAEEFSALLHTHLNELDYGEESAIILNSSQIAANESACDNLEVALTQTGGSLLKKLHCRYSHSRKDLLQLLQNYTRLQYYTRRDERLRI